jgi:glucose/arabinose dehydrogenase/mono/diheme cytochrome c family protein
MGRSRLRRTATFASAACLAAFIIRPQIETAAQVNAPAETTPAGPAAASRWGSFVEPEFPFFSSVLDARALGAGWPSNNLTPRGLILNLGHGYWACFDTDLLRVAAIWSGAGVTPVSMSQGSYHLPGEKAPEGQGRLPGIAGEPVAATGLYPGWQTGGQFSTVDPRPAGPDPREPGRGPVDPAVGRFRAVRMTASGVVLAYEVHGETVEERIQARVSTAGGVIDRHIRIARVAAPLWLIVGERPPGAAGVLQLAITGSAAAAIVRKGDRPAAVHLNAAPGPVEFVVSMSVGTEPSTAAPTADWTRAAPPRRWPESVTTSADLAANDGAFVVDRIPIPVTNPWRRNVRFADLTFLAGNRAAVVTFDGDVWTADGLGGDLREIEWRRFTSGLHEPLGIASRGGELFVFDRNGIWRLVDTDRNGEADRHELVANVFAQTAETREFAMSLRIAPDDSFVIAKGGQVGTTVGRDNGTVLRISADGRSVTRLGYGLRQPFASVDPRSGLVVASDQQGHYVPATPLHVIRDSQYYGFLPLVLPKEQYPAPIAEPLAWIPHAVTPSAAGQVWLRGARMGPLTDALVLIGYFRPELFLVRLNDRGPELQAAVISLTRDFDFAPLAGAVNPGDGQLYVTGFQIWGTEASSTSGMARYRYTGAPSALPREVVPTDSGVLVRFDAAMDRAAATIPANMSAERWNYRRTPAYGSPHFRLDGTRGQEQMAVASAYASQDGRSIFVALPDMQPAMQMRLGLSLKTAAGEPFTQNLYFTPTSLTAFNPIAEGFGPVAVDLAASPTRAPAAAAPATPATAAQGERIAARMGCVACHSTDGTVTGRIGPSWKGLFGARRAFADGTSGVVDAPYLRESILEPTARVVTGFDQSDAGMPSYAGVLTDGEIEAVILYIQSLK